MRVIWHFQTPDFSLVLEPGGIDHSESGRNNQSELIRNSQCTCLANYRQLFGRITDFYRISFQLPSNQCGAYSQQRCKHQYCCAVDCILQILFSSYLISPYHSINYQLQKSEAFQSVHHVTFILCYTVL